MCYVPDPRDIPPSYFLPQQGIVPMFLLRRRAQYPLVLLLLAQDGAGAGKDYL